jgi:predicted transcriptional regulator of viral defense system
MKSKDKPSRKILDQAMELFRRQGIVRSMEIVQHGIPRQYLRILEARGDILRVEKGLYVSSEYKPSEHHGLALAAKRISGGVICLLSALSFHKMTTQLPHQVWVALKGGSWHPRMKTLNVQIVRFSGESFDSGIEEHGIEGISVKIYSPAKTVADCFKYRNKVGLDVALEALRDYRRKKIGTMDDLHKYAKICRVEKVMRPYLEAME